MPASEERSPAAAEPAPAASVADVVTLPRPSPASRCTRKVLPALTAVAARSLPPLIMLALILGVWQILCMKPSATLPSPSRIWTEAKDLIVDPFFVAGPQDIGLGWRVLTSLQRVAIGFGLAAVVGIAGRRDHRPVGLGDARSRSDLPGAAHRAAARLAADLARRLPRQPALGDLRDLHHLDLADHHQHCGRHPQHPAGLPQRRARWCGSTSSSFSGRS